MRCISEGLTVSSRTSCTAHPGAASALRQFLVAWSSEDPPPPLQRWRVDEPAAPVAPEDHDLDPDTATSQENLNPMAGAQFASLAAPGPSGFRPEHVAAMLKRNRRRVVNRLLRAITATQALAATGAHTGRGLLMSHGFPPDLHRQKIRRRSAPDSSWEKSGAASSPNTSCTGTKQTYDSVWLMPARSTFFHAWRS